jgi:tetratricopeptide (TPR) repeat protein
MASVATGGPAPAEAIRSLDGGGTAPGAAERGEVDFFISRRGASANVAQEVAQVLGEAGYSILVQDFDIRYSANFIAAMHEALKRCRHLVVLLTEGYDASHHTLAEVTNFLAAAARGDGERRLVVLRVEACEAKGLLAGIVYGDLVGVEDAEQRRAIILAAAEGRPTGSPRRPKIFRGVPPRNPDFIGRDDLLVQVNSALTGEECAGGVNVTAVCGLGGIGKTSLAAEYAHRHGGEYAGVWWAPAENRAMLATSLAELASTLDARLSTTFIPRITTPTDLEQVARSGFAILANRGGRWLLVYDNVESPEAIRDLVPGSGACVLVTTRWADWGGWASEVMVGAMPPDCAVAFLLKRAGRSDREGAELLAAALGHLPLALDHAGAYVRLTGTPFSRYADRLRELIGKAPRGATYPASVGATFGVAIERAAGECPAAETLLGFFAVLAPKRIPLDLVDATILEPDATDDALIALTAVSLVSHDPFASGTPAVTAHRLVQAAMRARLADNGRLRVALERAIGRLAVAFPDNGYSEPKSWPRCNELLPHALGLAEEAHRAGLESADLARLLDGAANFLHGRGAFSSAEPLLRDAVAIGRRVLGSDHLEVGLWLNNLANIFLNSGRYGEAEPLYREAIEIGIVTLGRDNLRVATRMNNLAIALMENGQHGEAERLFREAIATVEKALGRNHHMLGARLHNLANLLARTGAAAEAEALYREAIAIGYATTGRDDPHVAAWVRQLANLCRDSGRDDEAEPLYRQAIEAMSASLSDAHPGVGRTREDLSVLLLRMGRAEEARAEALKAVSIQERSFGVDHAYTRIAAGVLANALDALGRAPEAHATRARHGI